MRRVTNTGSYVSYACNLYSAFCSLSLSARFIRHMHAQKLQLQNARLLLFLTLWSSLLEQQPPRCWVLCCSLFLQKRDISLLRQVTVTFQHSVFKLRAELQCNPQLFSSSWSYNDSSTDKGTYLCSSTLQDFCKTNKNSVSKKKYLFICRDWLTSPPSDWV